MRDIQKLDKQLLNSEFEIAKGLNDYLRTQGYAPYKIAAIIYRHGYLDGRDTQKEKTTEAYKKLSIFRAAEQEEELSPPEATEEGRNENE